MLSADKFENGFRVRGLMQQGSQTLGVHIVTGIQNHKSALNCPVMTFRLFLKKPDTKPLIVQTRPVHDGICKRPAFIHRS